MCPSLHFQYPFGLVILLCPLPSSQPSCHAPADPYVEHDALVVALDLILLKPGVYRHLLFNRGMPPRKAEEPAPAQGQGNSQQAEQRAEEKRVAATAQDTARESVRVLTTCALLDLRS